MGHEDDVSMTSSMQLPIPAIPPCEDEATDSCSLSSPAPDRSGDVVNPESVLDDVEAAPLQGKKILNQLLICTTFHIICDGKTYSLSYDFFFFFLLEGLS